MKADLHVHSRHSEDNRQSVKGIVEACRRLGIRAVAIADHNSLSGSREAMKLAPEGLIVVPAMEVTTEDGHMLAYDIADEIERGLSVAETIDRIHSQGGMAVAAHPYRMRTGLGEDVIKANRFDAIEGMNARSTSKGNAKAVDLADSLGLPITGGSDAHRAENVGRGLTIISVDCSDADDVIRSVRENRSSVEGRSRGRKQSIAFATKVMGNWAGRGFRKI
ncbi:MAG: CehA/McbA family metallohydrolase [Methanomassiliicoccales archaeon]|nr:CehA/McbA family metallohydrolase [Methanomassiliicoccales archaeon]